jgi:hypothetical protein
MRYKLALIGLLLASAARAQYVETSEEVVTPKVYKNQLGLGMNPLLVVGLGGDAQHVHYGIQYKRMMGESRMLRLSAFIQGGKNVPELGAPIGMTDTSLFVPSEYDNYEVKEFRIGMEWSNYNERFDGFYGFDFITGIDRQTGFEAIHEYRISAEDSPNLYGQKLGSDTLTYFTDDYLLIGLAPFFGYRVGIGRRFDLTAWLSPEFVYMAPLKSDTRGVQQIHRQNAYINFRLRLLDVMLSYKF